MLAWVTRRALSLRYEIDVQGLDEVAQRGTTGILFLANHPALIDPMILLSVLHPRFWARPVGDQDQAKRAFIRWVARRVRAITIPDPAKDGSAARAAIEQAIGVSAAALKSGDNLLVYPSGHIYTNRFEDVRGNSGVQSLLGRAPGARVVLLSLHGLWGSRFSRAQTGEVPVLGEVVRRSIVDLVAGGFFFLPRRQLTLTAEEPEDLPRGAPREVLNRYLEQRFNRGARPNTHVPYSPFGGRGPRPVAEPVTEFEGEAPIEIPERVRFEVLDHLRQVTGIEDLGEGDHLARDLGCDSLVRAELIDWVAGNLVAVEADVDSVQTVRDLLVVAAGLPPSSAIRRLEPVPARWFDGDRRANNPSLPTGETLVEVFVRRAITEPTTVILADQTSGVRTYRELLTGIFLLRGRIAALPGNRVGLMMPASIGADVLFLSALCAGKVPVMVNWTVGPRNVAHGLDLTGTEAVLTARALVERLQAQGVSFSTYEGRFVFLEDVIATLTAGAKVAALVRAHLQPRTLVRSAVKATAVILYTSGSESVPKAVPLSHDNLLSNLRDISARVQFEPGDRLLSVLPPFHSFGLTAGMLMPLLNGIPTVHSPNPYDASLLANLVGAYQATLVGGTPTLLAAMVGSAKGDQLAGLRLAVTGGEACPDRVYEALAERCGKARILEGYGITECSPIVSINTVSANRPGTIGQVLPSLDHVVIDQESRQRCQVGRPGLLLVRGPSVFDGYLGHDGHTPFVEFEGNRWFNTGDVVVEDQHGFLTFCGRRRRFVKRGGEMISLPAIETVLGAQFENGGDEGPTFAVIARGDDTSVELVLCTTFPLDRKIVNQALREAGLSPLHSIHRVEQVSEIPVLGTGKTDYRALEES